MTLLWKRAAQGKGLDWEKSMGEGALSLEKEGGTYRF